MSSCPLSFAALIDADVDATVASERQSSIMSPVMPVTGPGGMQAYNEADYFRCVYYGGGFFKNGAAAAGPSAVGAASASAASSSASSSGYDDVNNNNDDLVFPWEQDGCPLDCQNDGQCISVFGGLQYACICVEPFWGTQCEYNEQVDPCDLDCSDIDIIGGGSGSSKDGAHCAESPEDLLVNNDDDFNSQFGLPRVHTCIRCEEITEEPVCDRTCMNGGVCGFNYLFIGADNANEDEPTIPSFQCSATVSMVTVTSNGDGDDIVQELTVWTDPLPYTSYCICPDGYQGKNCEEIDVCGGCQNDGYCISKETPEKNDGDDFLSDLPFNDDDFGNNFDDDDVGGIIFDDDTDDDASNFIFDDIPGTAIAAGIFNTLVAALSAADLVDTLSGEGPFTVFAPTDDAFAAIPEELVTCLLSEENYYALTSILTYHVIFGQVLSTDLENGMMAATLLGEDVTINTSDGVVINDSATVVVADVMASNGVIHVIDAVLVPPFIDAAFLESCEEWVGDDDEVDDDAVNNFDDDDDDDDDFGNSFNDDDFGNSFNDDLNSVLCPSQPAANYCDCGNDCQVNSDWCSCDDAQSCCNGVSSSGAQTAPPIPEPYCSCEYGYFGNLCEHTVTTICLPGYQVIHDYCMNAGGFCPLDMDIVGERFCANGGTCGDDDGYGGITSSLTKT